MFEIPSYTKPPVGTQLRRGHWSTDDLVAHWGFLEGGGDRAFDGIGNNPGTLVNGPTWATSNDGPALEFNGATTFVKISDSAADAPYDDADVKTRGLALVARINAPRNADDNVRTIMAGVGDRGHSDLSAGGLVLFDAAGWSQLQFVIYDGAYQKALAPASTGLVTNRTYHVVGVVDPGASLIRLYIDGVQVATDTFNTAGTTFDPIYFEIGRSPRQNFYFLQHILDASIYNRLLKASEVAGLALNPNIVYEPEWIPDVVAAPVGVMAAHYYRTLLQGDRV